LPVVEPVNRLRVFVASPGDTEEERNRLSSVIEEINRGIARDRGLILELVRWETDVRPGMGGDAQEVINQQLPDADIVVGIFWKRLGTPTPRAESGTAEELEAAIEQWHSQGDIEILTYFNQSPYTLDSAELSQLERLLAFRDKLKSQGMLLWNYDGVPDFEAKARQHLTAAVRDWPDRAPRRADRRRAGARLERGGATPSKAVRAEVDVTRMGDVQTLASELRAELLERGFSGPAAARAATVLLELLANVRDHSASTSASVEVEVRTATIFCAVIEVRHAGPEFDLEKAVRKGWEDYQQGDREHGLVKVSRLASHLRLMTEGISAGVVGIECLVYDSPSIGSGILDELDGVTPVYLEFDLPKRWRFGQEIYAGRDLETPLHLALEKPTPRLLDLYLGGLRVPPGGYLAIEFVGNVLPSEIGPQPLTGQVAGIYPQPRSEHVTEAALEVQFNECFASQRVVMHAYETGSIPTDLLREWANLWEVPFFTEPGELKSFLSQLPRVNSF
jgi:anti-sigma regulatory factor (Ser/Thr protein kinase)